MSKRIWACALTGHRELPPDFNKNALYDKLEEFLKAGCDSFFCGMARGFDLLALECLVALKQKYRFYIEACIPYTGHENGLSRAEKKHYLELLEWCDQKTILFDGYKSGCFLARDRYMVDCSDVVLAYCTKETGGTAYTANYALKKGKPVVYIR